jgi:CBS domain containing-hemolysin-like protein
LYEATLYSTRIGTLEAAKSKHKTKKAALKMINIKRDLSIYIAAILILNTIANTAGATVAGMYAHKVLGTTLVPVFSIVFTLAILFIAEIIPKTAGAVHWRKLWPLIIFPLYIMKTSLYPLIRVTQKLTDFLTRGYTAPSITEEDILGAIRLGSKEGEISEWESLVVHNLINLENKRVREIMTPRTVMFTLDANMTVKEALKVAGEKGVTRIPIYLDDKENIVGYVMIHDLGSAMAITDPDTKISSLAKPISFEPESENCLTLLTKYLKKRRQIAVVEDEFGGVSGLITLEDLLETVLGTEIVDEKDLVDDLQKLARERRPKRSLSEEKNEEE